MFENEYTVAVDAVTRAASLCQSVRAALVSTETIDKMDKSPVTVADFGAQAIIVSAIKAAFPDDPIVAEENTDAICGDDSERMRDKILSYVQDVMPNMTEKMMLDAIDGGQYRGGGKKRFWALDPIDGTKGFVRGDQYAIALGLIEDGEVIFGVLGCPNLPFDKLDNGAGPRGVMLTARRGGGTVLQDMESGVSRPVMVSEEDDPARAIFCESFESGHTAQGASAEIVHDLGVDVAPARLDSQCKYAVVARGDAGVYMRLPTRADYEEKIWDHAAGVIIVEEAGGRVTDAQGNPLDFTQGRTLRKNKGVIATNGLLHDAVLAAINKALPELSRQVEGICGNGGCNLSY